MSDPLIMQVLADAHKALQAGDLDQAEVLSRRGLEINPQNPRALELLGVIFANRKNFSEAIPLLRRALDLQPGNGALHLTLGRSLLATGQLFEAKTSIQTSLSLRPDDPVAHCNLGNVLFRQGFFEQAIEAFKKAIALKADYTNAWTHLGNTLRVMSRSEESNACYERALQINPDLVVPRINMVIAEQERGELESAIQGYTEILQRSPENARAHFHRAICHLLAGRLRDGWEEYEWRWRLDGQTQTRPNLGSPAWDGTTQGVRRILLRTEQGFGDTFQFIRYARLITDMGIDVVVQCQPQLRQILSSVTGVSTVLCEDDALPPHDRHAFLLELPRIFKTDLKTIPAVVPYLQVNEERRHYWSQFLGNYPGFRIGICWQGNPGHFHDNERSFKLRQFIQISRIPGCQLFALQKGAGREQLEALPGDVDIVDLGALLDPGLDQFVDTAAVIENLDLVITADTAVAHLAGALGRPVWVPLHFSPDWRWMLNREDSPWYPTMRLFRQKYRVNWDEVFDRLTEAVQEEVKLSLTNPE